MDGTERRRELPEDRKAQASPVYLEEKTNRTMSVDQDPKRCPIVTDFRTPQNVISKLRYGGDFDLGISGLNTKLTLRPHRLLLEAHFIKRSDELIMQPLKIYMADLTHDTIILVSDTVPINIGFIGSYAKNRFGEQIDVSLFKQPQSLIDALKLYPPDILALSNYSWNSHLSERMALLAKEVNPKVVTVQGGTNFPHQVHQQREFLLNRPCTDFHVEMEGEVAFANVISRVMEAERGETGLFDKAVDGCVFIQPETRNFSQPTVVTGVAPARIKDLDEIPSPYINGMLDHFFDGKLTPFLETNRGCPFQCTFCHTGNNYFQKINMFSIERVRDEIEYIAPKVSALGIINLHIADTNFGMFPRDKDICLALKEAHDEWRWPLQIIATTGKNNKERVIDITSIMGKIFSVNMSVQSMDDQVLANIKRDNIKLDDYMKINEHLNEAGRATKGELILGMPGETKDTFLNGVERIIESGVSSVCIYTLMLLNGTEFQEPAYREKFGIKGKFRIVPLDFGDYDGVRVLDYEEVGVETNDLSFEDYLYVRGFALLVEALHNGRPFDELFRYAMSLGVSRADFIRRVYDRMANAPQAVINVMAGFLEETRNELWDSEENLVAHYQQDENYQRLYRGEVGGNLIYKYKSMSLAFAVEPWIRFLADVCKGIAQERLTDYGVVRKAQDQIDILAEFCRKKLNGLLNIDADLEPLEMESPYDIAGWLVSNEGTFLEAYASATPIKYTFRYSDEHLKTRADQFKRYGTDINALSKIVTRVSNIESLFRLVATPEGEKIIYADTDVDLMTRYMLAN